MTDKKLLYILCIGLLSLTACSNAKKQLGLERAPPDEFAVVKRAPLEMPPSYGLRPPRPGAPRPQEQTTSQQAKQSVFGASTYEQAAPASTGEGFLIQQAGGTQADPNIRRKVDAETSQLHDRNKPVAEKLFGLGGDKTEPSATVVDADAEAERLRENIEEGKSVTEGETPSIEE